MTNKELIMQNALELFANEGYENTGVLAIVSSANVTKPTLYHHFGSKDGLLISLYETHFNKLIKELNHCLPYETDTVNTIEKLIWTYIEFSKKEPLFFWLSLHLRKSPRLSRTKALVQTFYDQESKFLLNLITLICEYHSNLIGQENFLCISLLALINGFIEVHLDLDSLSQLTQGDVHKLAKQYLYGIYSL